MADFVEMPAQGGVGPYHFNRYRIVFDKPEAQSKESLAADLINQFPFHFDSAYARVYPEKRTFNGKPTLKFHGFDKVWKNRIDRAQAHNDWVVMDPVNTGLGFTARTLRRTFIDMPDDAESTLGGGALGGVVGGKVGGVVGAVDGFSVNRWHFLAGRRCWRLDTEKNFRLPGDRLVLETTAVERFSRAEYQVADAALGMEKLVPNIWCSLLWQFVKHNGLNAPQQPLRAGWTYGAVGSGKVQYYTRAKQGLKELMGDTEFMDAYCDFPSVIDLSATEKIRLPPCPT